MNPTSTSRPRTKNTTLFLSLVILAAVIFSPFVINHPDPAKASGSTTFTAEADAYVDESNSSSNYGSNQSLRVDGSPVIHSYLRFNISGIDGSVTKATLRIYANSKSSAGIEVDKVADSNWEENGITYANAPALGEAIGSSTGFHPNTWVSVDVTSYVQANGKISLAIVSKNETAIKLASRESGERAPQLVLESATPPTPTNTPGILVKPATSTPTNPPVPTPTKTATSTPGVSPTSPANYQPGFPIRAVFYYPWFPEAWNQQGYNPFTNYTPTLGNYDSGSVSVIQSHIRAMTYGNIQAAILSWWGQGSKTDQRVATILGATPGSANPNFRWSLYYENESQGDPAVSQITNDLTYIRDHYSQSSSFLRVNGKFVVFVYADANDSCGMADRWVQANKGLGSPAYLVLKVFSGYRTCASQPDSWHQYSPAVATDRQSGYSYAISPGFWKKGDAVRLARDLNTWTTTVKAMVASGEKWQLVTTFNEWGEGTSVESAQEWASTSGYGQYLDVLHNNGSGTLLPTPTSQPTSQPTRTSTPLPTAQPTVQPTNQPTSQPTGQPTPTPTLPASSNDPIIFFTSDLVSGSSVDRAQLVVNQIQKLMGQHPGTQMYVASSGDNEQESTPTLADYQAYFGSTYGVFVPQNIFKQVRGNHDVQDAGHGLAYAQYFGIYSHLNNGLTNYSYDLGSWHIIGLDQLSGSVNTTSLNFLTSDLAAHSSTQCQIVYWHVPTYSSGAAHGDSTGLKALNQAEYNAGVDIQLNGHDHDYQRFYPLNPSGQRDDAKGITTFVVGIGGQDGRSGSQTSVAQAASAVYLDAFPGGHAIGVVMFTLHANSADFELYDANSGSVLDRGTIPCH
jgi:hypothetical protein